jgi:uncharacterized protein (TIGR00369 family)
MRKINSEHIKAVIDMINNGPYFRLLSIVVCGLGPGYSKLEVKLENKHLNPFGGIHGGVYSSLIDTAAYWAVYCDLDENTGLISLDVNVDNLAPVKDGFLMVEGRRIKAGKNICLAEAVITDSSGRSLAHGTSKQMVTTGLQTITQAVAAMGYPPLPPKFITES